MSKVFLTYVWGPPGGRALPLKFVTNSLRVVRGSF